MSSEHDNHGQTPANWTGAAIITLAFVVGTLGVVFAQPLVFWIGVLLILVGIGAWKVMTGMESKPTDAL
ncbi:MAG: HGxxPAAW family protein [Candidatus Nanopelagicales bacterium]